MCGIAGVVHAPGRGPDRAELRRLGGLLRHRGPDEEGHHLGERTALVARRLAIIDVEGGNQPLSNEAGDVVLVGNGEVFNAGVLRRDLEARGHRFASRSDLEVVVHGYEEWGIDIIPRLRGMFALAISDEVAGRVVLARDRFGMKPLFHARAGGRFAFASEIRPLLEALPALPRAINPAAVAEVLDLGFAGGAGGTAVVGVTSVPPACTLVVDRGVPGEPRRYWSPPPMSPVGSSDAAGAFRERLREAVSAWTTSDVPVGALLSGGVDSSSIVSLMAAQGSGPPPTFTVSFAGPPHDEAEAARATAATIGSAHHEVHCTAADFDRWPEAVRRLETPMASATAVPLLLLYEACHDAGLKVIMTGEGADELLGGYHWFAGDRRARRLWWLPGGVRRLVARSPVPMSSPARRVLAAGRVGVAERYATWLSLSTPDQRHSILESVRPQMPRAWDVAGLAGRSPFDAFRFLEARTRLPDFVNVEVDRMSMGASVEARTPFLDHELWDWAATQPAANRRDKLLLRDAMVGIVPEPARTRRKWGLAAPHAQWWRRDCLPDWAEEALAPDALREAGCFRARGVDELRRQHRLGERDTSRLLAAVLTTQLFQREVLAR